LFGTKRPPFRLHAASSATRGVNSSVARGSVFNVARYHGSQRPPTAHGEFLVLHESPGTGAGGWARYTHAYYIGRDASEEYLCLPFGRANAIRQYSQADGLIHARYLIPSCVNSDLSSAFHNSYAPIPSRPVLWPWDFN